MTTANSNGNQKASSELTFIKSTYRMHVYEEVHTGTDKPIKHDDPLRHFGVIYISKTAFSGQAPARLRLTAEVID